MLTARVYWDKSVRGRGEIKIEPIHPKYIFFDEHTTKIDLLDGSLDKFVVAKNRPLSWYKHYMPDKDIQPDDIKDDESETTTDERDKALYIEYYTSDNTIESTEDEKGNKIGRKWKYPEGRFIALGGQQIIYDEPAEYFPYVVEPLEYNIDTIMGSGLIQRQIALQKDFNSKMAQISMNIALSANRQWLFNPAKAGMSLETFMQHVGEAGYIFPTKKLADDIKNAISALETPKFNAELFQYLYYIPQLMEQVSGITKLMQGMSAKRERQTKYEIGKQYEAGTIRVRNLAHHIESFLTEIALAVIRLIKKYYAEPRMIFRENQQTGNLEPVLFEYPKNEAGQNMDYDFIVTIQPDSMLPVDLQSQAERDMTLAQMNMLDPQTLLESLNHPRAQEVIQRLQQMAQAGQNPQGNTGIPIK